MNEKIKSWIENRLETLYEEQLNSKSLEEHNARNANIDDLEHVLFDISEAK